MRSFLVRTKQNLLRIEVYLKFIEKKEIKLDKKLFLKMCKEGCVNYEKKYSCPPFSPEFEQIMGDCQGLFIVLFLCKMSQINSTEYNKIRIANVIMKSRLDRLMRVLESKFKTSYLSTGSCRLCKPCKLKLDKPCSHPDKRRYSLESVCIDCDYLTKKLFNLPLVWYKNKKAPQYSCVVCGLICNKKESKKIEKEVNLFVMKDEI